MLERQFKILLIEDNPGDARLMREYLAAARSCLYTLAWAQSLAAALDPAARAGVDLIVLDLGLPDSRGLDTFLRLRQQAPAIPVVILTGLADESTAIEALRRGAQDYIVKGELSGEALVRALRYAIERDRIVKSGKRPAARRARLLVFVGAAAGAGASAVALNVASALKQARRTVILAEIRSGLRVLSLPAAGGAVFPEEPAPIEAALGRLQAEADCVVLDLLQDPAAGAPAVLPLCDYLAVVSGPEPSSLGAASELVARLETWGMDRRRIGLVVVARTLHDPLQPGELRQAAGCELLAIVPPPPGSSPANPSSPVVAACPQSDCALALIDLASRMASEPVVSRFV